MPYDLLAGIKIVEASMYAFAPSAAAVLADWGADVVKIVPVGVADPMANPGIIAGLPKSDDPVAFMWHITNRGKRCISVDLSAEDGREIVHKLVAGADIFLTNLLPEARRKYGLEIDDIRAVKPDIIYARATGHGPRGPESGSGGYDHTDFWARTGIAHAASQVADEFVPQAGPALGDLTAGGFLAGAAAAALLRRNRTGRGAVVDVSLLSAGMWVFSPAVVASQLFDIDTIPRVRHAALPNPLVAGYLTRDGRIVYLSGIRTDRGFEELCDALEAPGLASDERFSTGELRAENAAECIKELDAVFATRDLADWLPVLETLSSPWTVVQSAREAGEDVQVTANRYLTTVNAGNAEIPLVASPAQFDETPLVLSAAPAHGEHTDELLLEMGYDWDAIVDLKIRNTVL